MGIVGMAIQKQTWEMVLLENGVGPQDLATTRCYQLTGLIV